MTTSARLELPVEVTYRLGNGYYILSVDRVELTDDNKLHVVVQVPEFARESFAGSVKYGVIKPVGWKDK